MQKIANVAGISKGSLYFYFRNKDNLFNKIFDEPVDEYLLLVNSWTNDNLSWKYTGEVYKMNY